MKIPPIAAGAVGAAASVRRDALLDVVAASTSSGAAAAATADAISNAKSVEGETRYHRRNLVEVVTSWQQQGNTVEAHLGDYDPAQNEAGGAVALSAHGTFMAISDRYHESDGNPPDTNTGIVRVLEFRSSTRTWVQRGPSIYGVGQGDEAGRSLALSADGSTLAVGSSGTSGSDNGLVRVFHWDSSAQEWVQQGSAFPGPTGPNPPAGSGQGYSVSLSHDGNTVCFGAPWIDSQTMSGAFMCSTRSGPGSPWQPRGNPVQPLDPEGAYESPGGQRWAPQGATPNPIAPGSQFGRSLALSSDANTIVVGIPEYVSDMWLEYSGSYFSPGDFLRGRVYVYEWVYDVFAQTNMWKPRANLEGTAAGARFGYAVDISGDGSVVAVGEKETRKCYVYEWTPPASQYSQPYQGSWSPRGDPIDLPGTVSALKLSADATVVALGLESAQEARVYEWDGSSWTQRVTSFAAGSVGRERRLSSHLVDLGSTVAMSDDGNIVALGAAMEEPEPNMVMVYSDGTLPGQVEGWDLTFISLVADFTFGDDDVFVVDYQISKYRLVESYLWARDCKSPITRNGENMDVSRQMVFAPEETYDILSIQWALDKGNLTGTNIYDPETGIINFCSITQLTYPGPNNVSMVIVEDLRNVTVDLSLSVDFSIQGNVTLAGGSIDANNGTVDFDEALEAYKCDGLGTSENENALAPNMELYVCVRSTDGTVEIFQLDSMVINGVGLNSEPQELPVVFSAEPVFSAFTSLAYATNGNEVLVGTRVPTNLFDFNRPNASIAVSGAAVLNLAGDEGVRRLADGEGRELQESTRQGRFELVVDLSPNGGIENVASEEGAMMSSAKSTVAGVMGLAVLVLGTVLVGW